MRAADKFACLLDCADIIDVRHGSAKLFSDLLQVVKFAVVNKPEIFERMPYVSLESFAFSLCGLREVFNEIACKSNYNNAMHSLGTFKRVDDNANSASNCLIGFYFRDAEHVKISERCFDRSLSFSFEKILEFLMSGGSSDFTIRILDGRFTWRKALVENGMLCYSSVEIDDKPCLLLSDSKLLDALGDVFEALTNGFAFFCKHIANLVNSKVAKYFEEYFGIWIFSLTRLLPSLLANTPSILVYTCIEDVGSLALKYACSILDIKASEYMHGYLFLPSHLSLTTRSVCDWIYPHTLLCWSESDIELIYKFSRMKLRSMPANIFAVGSPLFHAARITQIAEYCKSARVGGLIVNVSCFVVFLNGYKRDDIGFVSLMGFFKSLFVRKRHLRVLFKTHPLHRTLDYDNACFLINKLNFDLNVDISDSNLPLPFWYAFLLGSNQREFVALAYDSSSLMEMDQIGHPCISLSFEFACRRGWSKAEFQDLTITHAFSNVGSSIFAVS